VHGVAVGDDAGFAGDTGPLAAVVEEAGVDVRVRGEVVGLSGFGVCVEDQIGSFLCRYALVDDNEMTEGYEKIYLGGESHAAADNKTAIGNACCHHAKLAPVDELK